jgi:aminopeptidase N
MKNGSAFSFHVAILSVCSSIYSFALFSLSSLYIIVPCFHLKVDPDDVYSTVPYEKGSQFLFFLESLVGNYEQFEEFLRNWIIQV